MKKIIRCSAILLAVLVLVTAYSIRVWQVNTQYPAPNVLSYQIKETAVYKGIEITVTDVYFSEDPVLLGEPVDSLGESKCLIAEITAKNIEATPMSPSMHYYEFQCGAARNAVNLASFYYLNENGNMGALLQPEESMSVKLPVNMFECHFTETQWNSLTPEDFQLVISFYPEKILFDF